MRRFQDWPARLNAYIEECRSKSFAWGRFDCVHFGAAWVAKATGHNPLKGLKLRYRSRDGAIKSLERLGYDSIAAAITAHIGEPLTSRFLARRGDIVTLPRDGMDGVGICVDERCVFLHPETGLTFVPLKDVASAWRV